MLFFAKLIAPSIVLLAGLFDDLKTQKIHNWLVGILLLFAIGVVSFTGGWPALKVGLLGAGSALLICVPFVLLGALGAGDMKLMLAFGVATSPSTVFQVLILSLIWGALLGLTKAVVAGEGKVLLKNMLKIMTLKKTEHKSLSLHKIPYTVALLFGWLTHLSLHYRGGGLL